MARPPQTFEQWLDKATEIHGDNYDYSKSNWMGRKSPIDIICKNCETEFTFSEASEHIRKPPRTRGCPINCRDDSIVRIKDDPKLSRELDLESTGKVRFWNRIVNPQWLTIETQQKLNWICSECNHSWSAVRTGGRSCPACAGKEVCNFDAWNSIESVFPNLASIWSDKNSIGPESVTFGSGKKFYFTCPENNPCEKTHLSRADNKSRRFYCPHCRKTIRHAGGSSMWIFHPDLIKFIAYPEKEEEYRNSKSDDMLEWKCHGCGDIHQKSLRNQVYRVKREYCNPCAASWAANNRENAILSFDEFISRANVIHNKGYEYDSVGYSGSRGMVRMMHKECGTWETRLANSHLQGTGCSRCADYGFDPHQPADYYVHEIIDNESEETLYFKAGISTNWSNRIQVLRRHLPEGLQIRYLHHIRFSKGSDARDFERRLLDIEEIRWPTIDFQGGTELFSQDPLGYASKNGLDDGLILEKY